MTVGAPHVAPPPPCPGGIAFNPGEQLPGPAPGNATAWRAAMAQWKACVARGMNYSGEAFRLPELAWTRTSYIQPQMHPYDRLFFDGENYTVQKWLDDVNARYGGVDSILMWPTCERPPLLAAPASLLSPAAAFASAACVQLLTRGR